MGDDRRVPDDDPFDADDTEGSTRTGVGWMQCAAGAVDASPVGCAGSASGADGGPHGRSHASPAPDGREYRPSMFVTLTLPSYGKVRHGVPVDPDTYDYRRAALDAVLFARLVDRFWDNLRRVAGLQGAVLRRRRSRSSGWPPTSTPRSGARSPAVIKDTAKATYV